MAAKKDEYGNLIEPEMPVAIDNTAVQKANQGYTAAKDALDAMSYDNFKQGSMYGGLKKSYSQQGQQAMKDTIGQVSARTGGMASSWAATAGQQSYNNYMQQLEDVARSMYNDEYSKARDKVDLAQGEYDRAYGEYRDKVSDSWNRYDADMQAYRYAVDDQRYDADKEEKRVMSDAYCGNAPTYAEYKANGGTLDERTYNSLVATAQGQYKDDNKKNRDTELEGILGAEGFDWDNHDWDGDGMIGAADTDGEGAPADFFEGSSYGEDYWKSYVEDADTTRKNTRIEAEKKNGTLINSLASSAGATLSAEDQVSFDEVYGDGSYDALQECIGILDETLNHALLKYMRSLDDKGQNGDAGLLEAALQEWGQKAASIVPNLTNDQLAAIVENMCPGFIEAIENPSAYQGKVYINGRWRIPQG